MIETIIRNRLHVRPTIYVLPLGQVEGWNGQARHVEILGFGSKQYKDMRLTGRSELI